jgi:hypothetical protein
LWHFLLQTHPIRKTFVSRGLLEIQSSMEWSKALFLPMWESAWKKSVILGVIAIYCYF